MKINLLVDYKKFTRKVRVTSSRLKITHPTLSVKRAATPNWLKSNMSEEWFVTHGARPSKGNGKKRKGVDEYAAEYWEDFVPKSMIREGQPTRVLVCRFCCLSVGARSDRIKEHLASKRHIKMKLEHFRAVQVAGGGPEIPSDPNDAGASNQEVMTNRQNPLQQQSVNFLSRDGEAPENMASSSYSQEETGNGGEIENCVENGGDEFWSSTTSSTTESCRSTSASPLPLPPPQSQQLMHVKWNNYNSNLFYMFSNMRRKEQFVDVTLMCEGRAIKCHRIVLAACSPYFDNFLKVMPYPSVVMISDIRLWELESLVEFMYSGEVKVGQGQLKDLLRAAQIYQVSGLGSGGLSQGLLGITKTTGRDHVQKNVSFENSMTTTTTHLDNHFRNDNHPAPANHSYHYSGVNVYPKTSTNNNQTPRQFGTLGMNPVMGIDMTARKTALEPMPPPHYLNGGNGDGNTSLPFNLSAGGNGNPDGGLSSQAANRKRKKATRRIGNLNTPRGMPLLLPIQPFLNSSPRQSSMSSHPMNCPDGSKSKMQQSQSVVWSS